MNTETSSSQSVARCFACQVPKETTKFAKCSQCHYAIYCNSDCQKAHWSEHKALCKFIKKSNPFFLNKGPQVRNIFIKDRVELFDAFPPDCSEKERLNIEMTRIRQRLLTDLQNLDNGTLCIVGYMMLIESLLINIDEYDREKALAFCNTPHALHLYFLISQQLICNLLINIRRVYPPFNEIKQKLLDMWAAINQVLKHEQVCMKMLTIWNDPLPEEIDGVLLAPSFVYQDTTIKSLLVYCMSDVAKLGDDLEGLVLQMYGFTYAYTRKMKFKEDEVKSMRKDVLRHKREQGENIIPVIRLFDFVQTHTLKTLRSQGVDIR